MPRHFGQDRQPEHALHPACAPGIGAVFSTTATVAADKRIVETKKAGLRAYFRLMPLKMHVLVTVMRCQSVQLRTDLASCSRGLQFRGGGDQAPTLKSSPASPAFGRRWRHKAPGCAQRRDALGRRLREHVTSLAINASPRYLILILFGGSMGLIGSGMVLPDGWLQGRPILDHSALLFGKAAPMLSLAHFGHLAMLRRKATAAR